MSNYYRECLVVYVGLGNYNGVQMEVRNFLYSVNHILGKKKISPTLNLVVVVGRL